MKLSNILFIRVLNLALCAAWAFSAHAMSAETPRQFDRSSVVLVVPNKEETAFEVADIVSGNDREAKQALKIFNSVKDLNLKLFKDGNYQAALLVLDGRSAVVEQQWESIIKHARRHSYMEFWIRDNKIRVGNKELKLPNSIENKMGSGLSD